MFKFIYILFKKKFQILYKYIKVNKKRIYLRI